MELEEAEAVRPSKRKFHYHKALGEAAEFLQLLGQ